MSLTWVPHVLTTGNLVAGFCSIILSGVGEERAAGLLILIAALLDGMDGQIARLLKADGTIGKELDSLADCVSFGVAAGCLAYSARLSGFGLSAIGFPLDPAILLAALFPVCAAYRLARFNTGPGRNSFQGLPSPVAGIFVALVVLSFPAGSMPWPLFVVLFCAVGLLMVSTIPYSKPQSAIFSLSHPLSVLILLAALTCLLLLLFGLRSLLFAVSAYILSGPITGLVRIVRGG